MAKKTPMVLQLIVKPSLHAAVKAAADREMMTMSEYVRRILCHKLGICEFMPVPHTENQRARALAAFLGRSVAANLIARNGSDLVPRDE